MGFDILKEMFLNVLQYCFRRVLVILALSFTWYIRSWSNNVTAPLCQVVIYRQANDLSPKHSITGARLSCHITAMWAHKQSMYNTLRPRQNGRHFPDDIFKWIFLNENVWISINISLKFVPRGPINNIPALVQVMAWRRPGHKPLSEPMMVRLPTHHLASMR